MDTTLLEHYRQRLLAQRQQVVQRLFGIEADLATLTADHAIETKAEHRTVEETYP